ncbi:MAG: hypothetical protein Q9227_004449 [Pyrenula ochraceoflavens]
MASPKRKLAPEAVRPKQKRRKVGPELTTDKADKNVAARPKGSSKQAKSGISLSAHLPAEPELFPRGGASLLTPVERKQIQAQASQDILFDSNEQNTKTFSESDDSNNDGIRSPETGKVQGKNKRRKVRHLQSREQPGKTKPRIESLKFKNIHEGSILLGKIANLTGGAIELALPNGLTGHVSVAAVSQQVTARLELILSQGNESIDEQESSPDDGEVDLKEYFHKGQHLRCYTTSTERDLEGKSRTSKKQIDLSLEPKLCNSGMDASCLVLNNTIQASIASVEDHGMVMDLGIQNTELKGFLPKAEIDEELQEKDLKPGMVMLCLITGQISNQRTVKLSASSGKLGNFERNFLTTAPTVNALLPGTAVEILLSDVTESGLAGQIMGMLDVSCDVVHSGMRDLSSQEECGMKTGMKIRGRLIFKLLLSDRNKLGFSLLSHILKYEKSRMADHNERLSLSDVHSDFLITRVEPGLGIYTKRRNSKATAFVHLSRLANGIVDSIAQTHGPYRIGSVHQGRVLSYNALDNLYTVSFQESIINQAFIRIEDVSIGQKVKGTVERVITREGEVTGVLVSLSDGIVGLIPRIHMSDAPLLHPEKRFRSGLNVVAKVLSTDVLKHQIRLTIKKSLVNADTKIWNDIADIKPGATSPGTLVKVEPHGAVVHFLGDTKGYLPVSEMSEAYIKDATQHFREGQAVTVTALAVDLEEKRLTLTCKDPNLANESREQALQSLVPRSFVSGKVFEKTEDDLLVRLDDSDVIARLEMDFICDGSRRKRESTWNKIRVGQKMQDVFVLDILSKRNLVKLCNRASLKDAAKNDQLPCKFEDLRDGMDVKGFISNITEAGIFVTFAGGLTGLLSRGQLPPEIRSLPDYGMYRNETISANVCRIEANTTGGRFWLTNRSIQDSKMQKSQAKLVEDEINSLKEPVDGVSRSVKDFVTGYQTKARVVSVKDTQLNVILAKDVQGRIDISEVFDSWRAIKDKKRPLRSFQAKQVLSVRILGLHDTRNHRFLPVTHRSTKNPVFEVSAKPSCVTQADLEILTLEKVAVGSAWIGFVNKVAEDCVWVNITPNIRGRVKIIDLTEDLSMLKDIAANFPIGSALRIHVRAVDLEKGHLDLSAKGLESSGTESYKDLSVGMVLPGRVTRVNEGKVLVQLSENIVGAVELIDAADDFAKANFTTLQKNDIVRVCVLDVDVSNKKISLSTRPSKVLSSSLPVKDFEIMSIEQVKLNGIYRGFVTNVADNGIFVVLGHNVTAFVRVTNLSDAYLKDWKDNYQRDQLIQGRVIAIDLPSRVQMSLKESVLKADYQPPLTLDELNVGQIVTGKVAKVEDFGVFIVVDNSANVRGLCHRSEIAERPVHNVQRLYTEGDVVKAKVLKIEPSRRRVNFGLKASYFKDSLTNENGQDLNMAGVGGYQNEDQFLDESSAGELSGSESPSAESSDGSTGSPISGLFSQDERAADEFSENEQAAIAMEDSAVDQYQPNDSLDAGGFDWTGFSTAKPERSPSASEEENMSVSGKKRTRSDDFQANKTTSLDVHNEISADNFEIQLLRKPASVPLWLQYMAFQLELGEVDMSRQVAQRALDSIDIGRDQEKLKIWEALLRLENAHGDDDNMQDVFTRACQHNDPQEIHNCLVSIYIQSDKYKVSPLPSISSILKIIVLQKADELFQEMLKKFSQNPQVWTNYAAFLFDSAASPGKARQLLPRAMQALPERTNIDLTRQFAQLEFRSPHGLPERGRTIFEGLLSSFPKRVDLWNVLLDQEIRLGDKEHVRALFERIFQGNVKSKQAKFFFKKWLAFEEQSGDERSVEAVKKKAAEFVRHAGRDDQL